MIRTKLRNDRGIAPLLELALVLPFLLAFVLIVVEIHRYYEYQRRVRAASEVFLSASRSCWWTYTVDSSQSGAGKMTHDFTRFQACMDLKMAGAMPAVKKILPAFDSVGKAYVSLWVERYHPGKSVWTMTSAAGGGSYSSRIDASDFGSASNFADKPTYIISEVFYPYTPGIAKLGTLSRGLVFPTENYAVTPAIPGYYFIYGGAHPTHNDVYDPSGSAPFGST